MPRVAVGVLALQGCVEPHRPHLEALGLCLLPVRHAEHLSGVSGLILPGGESPVMVRLLERLGLWGPLALRVREIPVWGICAGAILAAKSVDSSSQRALELIDLDISRNAYGRQRESFTDTVGGYPVCFIRAPKISRVGIEVEVLARRGGEPTWVRRGQVMVSTFHPELSRPAPSPMHQLFAAMVVRSGCIPVGTA